MFFSKKIVLFSFLILGFIASCKSDKVKHYDCLEIEFWYGKHQVFGKPGIAQKWINILGNVKAVHGIQTLYYSLNEEDTIKLSWGQDKHRLSNNGDFNIDINIELAEVGDNSVEVSVIDSAGHHYFERMTFDLISGSSWPLPYSVNWSEVSNIQDAVQVVDGNWELTSEGIRTKDPWYDRVIAIGDSAWRNYELTTTVIFHGYTSPVKEPPNYGVSHAALASRWPGHDLDHYQPHRKWYPLGATCEFQLKDDLDSCRWRILGGQRIKMEDDTQLFAIQLGNKYYLKSRVDMIDKDSTRYSVKIWSFKEPEPEDWDLTTIEGPGDIQSGSALIIAHNTDVTFGNIYVNPVK